jgi:UDP-N-acetylmuramoyl-L-alanyl-D-glutamate--2,6-diaminopimelate ligase
MVGRYNVLNALAALAAVSEAGVPLDASLRRLKTFRGCPDGCRWCEGEPFAVVVDFAHTPPALTKALQAVRPQVAGKLIVVVGRRGSAIRESARRSARARCGTRTWRCLPRRTRAPKTPS